MSNQNSNQDQTQQSFEYDTLLPNYCPSMNIHFAFDQFGLRWPQDHLDRIWPEIITWPLPLLTQYVDQVVFEIISKNDPEEMKIIESSIEVKGAAYPNTTSVGNLAFIAMYAKDSKIKQLAYDRLNKTRIEVLSALETSTDTIKPIAQA